MVFTIEKLTKAEKDELEETLARDEAAQQLARKKARKRKNTGTQKGEEYAQKPQKYKQTVDVYSGLNWQILRDEFLSKKWPEEDFSREPARREGKWIFETPKDLTEDDWIAITRLTLPRDRQRPASPDDINSPTSSDVESIFSLVTESQLSLSDLSSVAEASDPEGKESAIVLLIDLLYRDEALYNLYYRAGAHYSPKELQTHLLILFKTFGKDLKQEVSGEAQSKASAFVRASASHVARIITEAVSGKPEESLPQVPTEDHKARTEAWLRKQKGLQQISQLRILDETEHFSDLGELDDKEVHMTYQSLNGLTRFLRYSAAFAHLKRKLSDMADGVEFAGGNLIVGKSEYGPRTACASDTGTLQAAISSDCADQSKDDHEACILRHEVSELVRHYCDEGEHLERPEGYRLSSVFVHSAVSAWLVSKSNTNTLLDLIVQVAPFSAAPGIKTIGELPLSHPVEESNPEGRRHEKALLFASAWQAPQFISTLCSKQNHGKGPQKFSDDKVFDDIANTAIITGSHDMFEIGTSRELLEMMWPDAGLLALRVIAKIVAVHLQCSEDLEKHPMPVSVDFGYSNDVPQSSPTSAGSRTVQLYKCTSDGFIIQLAAGYPQHLPRAMGWICAALRLAPENEAVESGVIYKSHGTDWHEEDDAWDTDFLAYGLHPLKRLTPEECGPNSCWTRLFTPGMTVWHENDKPWGKGLGMSFAMLCHLSAARDYLWISDSADSQDNKCINANSEAKDDETARNGCGGYILGGFRTAVIPIRQSEGGTEIQWHLETIDTHNGFINHCNLQTTEGEWLKIQDLSGLQHTKVFLGWCKNAQILLGTNQLTRTVQWSNAEQRTRTLHRAGYNVGVSTGPTAIVTSPAQLATSIATTVNFVSNIQVYKPSKDYADALSDDCEKTAMVIDYDAQRAFLVPKLSLVLHLCHIESRRVHRYANASIDFPTATPSVDGAEAAHKALRENGDKIVIGVEGRGDATTLEALLLRIYHALKSSAANCEPPKRLGLLGTKIFGRELRGIIERPDEGLGLSVVQDYKLQSWVRLAELADVVCVCSNLGSAIRPAFADGQTGSRNGINELQLNGKLDFGNGYIMRWKGHLKWEKSHDGHRYYWENSGLLQFVWKEDSVDAILRWAIGTEDKSTIAWKESPGIAGALVFGVDS
ncbi:Histidine kinase hhk6p [Apiospora sp. TS-2023a]